LDYQSLAKPFAGGVLIGVSAGLFMLFTGRIAGISGIAGELTKRWPARWPQSLAFLAGLPMGLVVWRWLSANPVEIHIPHSTALLGTAGLLVGLGTGLANGCTSGHGVCGLARRSPRSVAATGIFMLAAILTVIVKRAWE